jgi:hypothetical protein
MVETIWPAITISLLRTHSVFNALSLVPKVQTISAMEAILRESEFFLEESQAKAWKAPPEVSTPGSIFAFVPAHAASKTGAVAEQLSHTLAEGLGLRVLLADFEAWGYSLWRAMEGSRRLDGRTWGALVTRVNELDVLQAREVNPRQLRQLLEYAREHYDVVCVDLSGTKKSYAREVMRACDGIFVVTDSGNASIQCVREKMDWLNSTGLGHLCGILLERGGVGVTVAEAEQLTGLPVCSLIDDSQQIENLAVWLARDGRSDAGFDELAYAIAV